MRHASRVIAVLAVVLVTAGTAWAQTATGQITGTVTDSTGAVMPGVKVVVTSQQTGLTRETTTSDVGTYVVPLLPVGVYLVTAEQQGFKVAVKSDIQLNVDQVQRIDLQLEAGDVSERVVVRADATALDTETASGRSSANGR
jgi:Carboxypeptidase regulatory-like domain